MNKAVFLDQDGTIIYDIPYNVNPSLIRLLPGSGRGLNLLKKMGYKLIVVANQSGIARGMYDEFQLRVMENELNRQLEKYEVTIDAFYYCHHHLAGIVPEYSVECTCRKPKAGLVYKAAQELEIDLSQSWMVGDSLDDVETGNRAGCRTILIANGGETEWKITPLRQPEYVSDNLENVAGTIILRNIYNVFMEQKKSNSEQFSY